MKGKWITNLSEGEELEAFSVEARDSRASVILIHEVWGLDAHIQHFCKRLSKLGFTTIAPDLYCRHKLLFTRENIQNAVTGLWDLPLRERYNRENVIQTLRRKRFSKEVMDLATTLYSTKFRAMLLNDLIFWGQRLIADHTQLATIGLSMGGGLALKLAARLPQVASCITFCGEPPPPLQLKRINAPILAIHAGQDQLMNSRLPNFVNEALKQQKNLTVKIYGHAHHEFFNDTNKRSYNREAAEDAWSTAEAFLRLTLA